MGKHSEKPGGRAKPKTGAPQTEKDPKDPKYDLPKTFGKGWIW